MIKTSSNKACNYFSLLFTLLVRHSELQACSLYLCCCKIPLAFCIFPSWFLPFSPSLLMCHTPIFALEWILPLIPIDYLCVHWQFHRARFGGRGLGDLFKSDSPCWIAGKQVMTCGFITGRSLLSFRLSSYLSRLGFFSPLSICPVLCGMQHDKPFLAVSRERGLSIFLPQ